MTECPICVDVTDLISPPAGYCDHNDEDLCPVCSRADCREYTGRVDRGHFFPAKFEMDLFSDSDGSLLPSPIRSDEIVLVRYLWSPMPVFELEPQFSIRRPSNESQLTRTIRNRSRRRNRHQNLTHQKREKRPRNFYSRQQPRTNKQKYRSRQ